MRFVFIIYFLATGYVNAQSGVDPYAAAPSFDVNGAWCTSEHLYATSKEKFIPNGAITNVGPYAFRVCQGGVADGTADRRVMRFFYNPQRVEGLSSIKGMSGLMVNALSTWEERLSLLLRSHVLTGEETFGGETYKTYNYVFAGSGNLGPKTYLFDSEKAGSNNEIPPHSFKCTEEVAAGIKVRGRCLINVEYGEIWASLLFLSPGDSASRIPIDRFPVFAKDVKLILQTADVTDAIEKLPERLPFVE